MSIIKYIHTYTLPKIIYHIYLKNEYDNHGTMAAPKGQNNIQFHIELALSPISLAPSSSPPPPLDGLAPPVLGGLIPTDPPIC